MQTNTPTQSLQQEKKLAKDPLEKNFSDNAIIVLKKRYLAKNEKGKIIETISGMFERVAKNIAEADSLYGKNKKEIANLSSTFFDEMASLRFLPNSPTLMNAGRPLQQLSACFVLPIEDSMESIFETIKNTALIHQSGGGTGFSFSKLRPKNDMVHSTKGVSSGPISFMQVFNSATEAIKQGGTRRGANMGILNIDHPDIFEFITSKKDTAKLNNFNISVAITEDFMEKAMKNEDYPLINPRNKKIVKYLNAGKVFDLIVEMAWSSGEPGIIFIDRINKLNPVPLMGKIESTNPCGEQPLLPYESCNLGSINIGKFVKTNDSKEHKTPDTEETLKRLQNIPEGNLSNISDHPPDIDISYWTNLIDWESLRKTIHIAVHFLDNVIDKNHYPLEKIKEVTRSNRKIGLGIMGYADTLIKLEVPYNSEIALKIAEEIMKFINEESKLKSQELGNIRGSFPNFETSIWKDKGYSAMRNATTTTIAPTGTISIIGGASSGIEPLFALAYERRVLDNQTLIEVDKNFKNKLYKLNLYPDLNIIDFVLKNGDIGISYDNFIKGIEPPSKNNSQQESITEASKIFDEVSNQSNIDRELSSSLIPSSLRRRNNQKLALPISILDLPIFEYLSKIFVTSHNITPKWHVLTQASFQKYTDNAVSKTVNFPNSATKDDIKEVYTLSFKLNLKGITVYRDGSRQQVLTTKTSRDSNNACPVCGSQMGSEKINRDTQNTTDDHIKTTGLHGYSLTMPRKRPEIIHGVTIKIITGCGPLYVTINNDENGKPFEVFNSIGKSGGCAQSQTESIGRMVSLALRSGMDDREIINQLKGIRCNMPHGFGESVIYSCADAIGKALEKSNTQNLQIANIEDKKILFNHTSTNVMSFDTDKPLSSAKNNWLTQRGACPSCGGSNLKHAEGCTVCLDCGYSDCG